MVGPSVLRNVAAASQAVIVIAPTQVNMTNALIFLYPEPTCLAGISSSQFEFKHHGEGVASIPLTGNYYICTIRLLLLYNLCVLNSRPNLPNSLTSIPKTGNSTQPNKIRLLEPISISEFEPKPLTDS